MANLLEEGVVTTYVIANNSINFAVMNKNNNRSWCTLVYR